MNILIFPRVLNRVPLVRSSMKSCFKINFTKLFSTGSSGKGQFSIVFVAVPDVEAAKSMAHELIERKLAACVKIIPDTISIYEWKGEMTVDEGSQLVIKTLTSTVDKLTQYVDQNNYSYDLNEIVSFPIQGGNPLYLKWIGEQVPAL